jgi:lysozyme
VSKAKTGVTVASAAALALCCTAVKKSEGYWPTVKVDKVGTGRPCTGGYGETENVRCGETESETFWSDRLKMRLADEYDREIGKCIHVELPDSVRAAAITTAYNAGSVAVCKSPMVAKWNAGDFRGGCKALANWYIRAQGRVLQGLINRRRDDMRLCLSGLNDGPQTSMTPTGETVHGVTKPWPKGDAPTKWVDAHAPPLRPYTPLPKPRPAPVARPWYWWALK